ncbi:hypothetical protein [Sphingobacterium sp. G1-14]|uniref:hypothetical protein n=1 Tax=Sphingobacterium sp. G1-14 TaxID=2003121 RepID=UPI000B491C19|nr:hypothetical protein [Sphingobacterium sp. G1-14]
MNNQDKMLQLVLSDDKLYKLYEYNLEDYTSIDDALDSDNPIVAVVAKIIKGISGNPDKGIHKEVYNEVINYLNQNIL